jgi:hypothetical protein
VGQRGLQPFLHQLPPRSFDIGDAGVQSLGDPAVAPAFASFRDIRLQKDARLGQQSRRPLACANKPGKLLPLLRAQPHDVFFDGNFFPGHESPPSLLQSDSDSELAVEINDGRHYPNFAARTTLYASKADIAVNLSAKVHVAPRAGYFEPYTVAPGVDTIAVPDFDVDLLGHGYFARAEALLHDIFDLFKNGDPPNARQRIKPLATGAGWRLQK